MKEFLSPVFYYFSSLIFSSGVEERNSYKKILEIRGLLIKVIRADRASDSLKNNKSFEHYYQAIRLLEKAYCTGAYDSHCKSTKEELLKKSFDAFDEESLPREIKSVAIYTDAFESFHKNNEDLRNFLDTVRHEIETAAACGNNDCPASTSHPTLQGMNFLPQESQSEIAQAEKQFLKNRAAALEKARASALERAKKMAESTAPVDKK